jgi:hypothetical protein
VEREEEEESQQRNEKGEKDLEDALLSPHELSVGTSADTD